MTDLQGGRLEVVGQLVDASNGSLLCRLQDDLTDRDDAPLVIYKPTAGERPLWDFPEGTLSRREVAAFIVSDALGWHIVPPTVWRDGPYGSGMVQRWVDVDDSIDLVAMVQGDDPQLRLIATFDALINNGDRKGGHLLPTPDGVIWGIDHGVSFAVDDKLRTVLWQWRGLPLPDEHLAGLQGLLAQWARAPRWLDQLADHLASDEIDALRLRAERLVRERTHPMPSPHWPAIPWPPF